MPTKLHNKLLKYIIQIYSNFVGTQPRPLKRLRNIAPFGKFCFSLFLLCGLSVILDALPSSASSVSISVTSASQTADIMPTASSGVFGKTDDITVFVTTDNASGYSLTIAGKDDTRQLVGINNSNKLDSITSAISENTFDTSAYDNKWGFLPSKLDGEANTSYQPGPLNSTPTVIDVTNAANATATTYALAIGARVNSSAAKDTYSTTFTLVATTNPTSYNIAYVNAAANMPDPTIGSTEGTTVTLSSQVPTMPGYVFTGWCSAYTTNNTCSGNIYKPGATYSLAEGAITNLYAMWTEAIMQDIGSWGQYLTANVTAIAKDIRDGTTYTVGKLADGNIWMLENLVLGSTTQTYNLTSDDSNVSSNFTLPTSISSGFGSYTAAQINSGSINTSDSYGKYGVYYNYCAASAGSNCAPGGSGEFSPTQDICPKGWKLPTGGSSGQFEALYTAYSSNYTNFRNAFKLPLSGYFYDGSAGYQGSYGYFWSSTPINSYNMYRLTLDSSSVFPQDNGNRYDGYSIRCVAEKTMQNVAMWKDDLSEGDTLEVKDTRDGTTYTVGKLADGNIWMLENLALGGTDSITLTGSDTNLATESTTYTLPASGTECFDSDPCTNGSGTSGNSGYEVAAINIDSANLSDSYGKYGVYYNYCAASAGSNCAVAGSGEFSPTQDICPKGWKLPTGGASGQFEALYTAYSSNYTNFRNAFKLPRSGVFRNGSAYNRGSLGRFWSSTPYDGSSMYHLSLDSSYVNPQNYYDRYFGYSIRCVAQ